MALTSILHALLSILLPQSGDRINVTVNNNHNINQITQQTEHNNRHKQTFSSFIQRATTYKTLLMLATLAATYLTVYLYLIRLSMVLTYHDCWSLWRDETPLILLKQIPEEQLAQELVLVIERKYISIHHPMDFFTPLASFLFDVEKELRQLKRYERLTRTIRWMHISRAFSIQHQLIHDIPSRIERLEYLKSIFLNWAASYKLNHQRPELLITPGHHMAIHEAKK